MEYEKSVISLNDKQNKACAFIFFYKRADKLVLNLKGVKNKGVLCVYSKNKMCFFNLHKSNEYILSDKFNFFNDYFFMLKGQQCLYGVKGQIENTKEVIQKLEKALELSLKREREKMNVTKTEFVENIISKMFCRQSQMFFDYTKGELSRLFISGKKCELIESQISHSKFVECGDEHSKSYFGIVYKNNLPYAICVGVGQNGVDTLKHDNCYQYVQTGSNQGVFLSARSSADGDLIIINQESFK